MKAKKKAYFGPTSLVLSEAKPSYVYSILKPHRVPEAQSDPWVHGVYWNKSAYIASKILFSETSLSVPMSVPVLSPSLQKSRWNRKFCYTKLSDILQGWQKNIQSNAAVLGYTLEFHHLPRVSPKQLCALAHLGCTYKVGTSYYIYKNACRSRSIWKRVKLEFFFV